jgi:hypothetical protein
MAMQEKLYYVFFDGEYSVIEATVGFAAEHCDRGDECFVCDQPLYPDTPVITTDDGCTIATSHVICVLSNPQVSMIWMTEREAVSFMEQGKHGVAI